MPIARINNHDMYYEVIGQGDPVLCMGGWGSFCRDNHHHLARGLTERNQVIIFDYRGIGQSSDDPTVPSTMALHADDAIGMLNTGAWCEVDSFLRDQLDMFRTIHRDAGFFAFQKLVTLMSFTPEYYNTNKDKLLGPQGGWKELNGRYEAHSRLVDACIAFDSRARLAAVRCPTLVIHAALDIVTSPRTTLPIEQAIPGAVGETWDDLAHVVAGKEQKIRFCQRLFAWLDSH
ncbi:MAG: alpha/beta hydrolase [Gammaproteobacteria bacterium]|nr:alpha/beta hydrolase [Gammaproteobacteria bacterium]